MYTDKDLKLALKNLARDGVIIGLVEGKNGDCEFMVKSKSYKTVIGCNDLGFGLVSQTRQMMERGRR